MTNATISLHERTIGEIAAEIPASIRVFEAWKIDYCCGGKRPLVAACAAAGKSVDEFAAAIDAAATVPDVQIEWSSRSLGAISAHITDTYHRFTREELATFAPLAAKVFSVHGQRRPELAEVVSLIRDVTGDMLPHMLKEEQILFPYVGQLESAAEKGGPAPTPFFGTVKNPVRMMMLEHDRVGDLLVRLRSLTNDYIPPESACFSYRELYRRLAEFERLTHEHIHVENNVYFPRAVSLEERSGSTSDLAFSHACGTASCT